jgi:hypothetical protein
MCALVPAHLLEQPQFASQDWSQLVVALGRETLNGRFLPRFRLVTAKDLQSNQRSRSARVFLTCPSVTALTNCRIVVWHLYVSSEAEDSVHWESRDSHIELC